MSKKTLELDFQDHVKLAKIAGLKYVTDTMPGIRRIKKGNGWQYVYDDGSLCKDEETLLRIKQLVLPPAWQKVWICPFDSGHLQATGIDSRQRKQYKYHAGWGILRNETKFIAWLSLVTYCPK
jgi:DNA topoisomerase-1